MKEEGVECETVNFAWGDAVLSTYTNEEDEYIELTDIISYWMEDNTVNHAPTRTDATENFITFEQVRIPLYKERNGRQSALDARGFANSLRSYLKNEPFLIESKIYERGLGEVWIIIGEK